MDVHNIFNDILVALSSYFNKNILKGIEIKEFHYNIGNASFEYDFNYEPLIGAYPFGFLSITDFSAVNIHPYSFMRHINTNNFNSIPLLINRSKNIALNLQEDLYTLNIEFLVQCDSQLSAINFKNRMISFIPLNKPLQFFELITFLELNDKYINKFLFDPEKDDIDNLFMVHNNTTGNFDYNAGYLIKPFIKLNGASINISSQTQYFYDLNFSFEILTTYPVRLNRNAPELSHLNSENRKYTNISRPGIYLFLDDTKHVIKINDNVYYDFDKSSHISDNILIYDLPEYYVEFEEKKIYFSFESITNKSNGYGYIINDNQVLVYSARYNGSIKNYTYNKPDNIISGRLISEKINEDVTINIKIKNETYKIKKVRSKNNVKIKEFNYYEYNKTILPINKINKYGAIIEPSKTKIIEIKLRDGTIYTNLDVSINQFGEFNYDDMIFGKLDVRTGGLLSSNINELSYILFNLNIDHLPIYGSDIEDININISLSNSSILDYNNIKLLSHYNLHKYNLIISDPKLLDEQEFKLELKLSHTNLDVNDLKYNFIFTNCNTIMSNSNHEITLDKINSTNIKLIFYIEREFFYKYFSIVSIYNPIFFTFGELING